MEGSDVAVDYDIAEQIDWDSFFNEFPKGIDVLALESPVAGLSSSAEGSSDPPSGSLSSWIDEIENILMADDDTKVVSEASEESCDQFLAEVLVDSRGEGSAEVVHAASEYNASDDRNGSNSDKEKVSGAVVNSDDVENPDNPISRRRKRQLRNRDAAVRSRERKKMYVKDLEMKNKYLEGECRRLEHLLQLCYAENQALRFSVQMGLARGASMTKQESAVLLLGLLSYADFTDNFAFSRIPAVGFPALVTGHQMPAHPASNSGCSSTGKRGKDKSRTSGSGHGKK